MYLKQISKISEAKKAVPRDANANSGKNSNRTTQATNGVTTNFCYDYADRLTSSSDTLYAGTTYDTHGNMTNIGTGTTPLHFYYDSSDRSSGYEQTTSAGTGTGSTTTETSPTAS